MRILGSGTIGRSSKVPAFSGGLAISAAGEVATNICCDYVVLSGRFSKEKE